MNIKNIALRIVFASSVLMFASVAVSVFNLNQSPKLKAEDQNTKPTKDGGDNVDKSLIEEFNNKTYILIIHKGPITHFSNLNKGACDKLVEAFDRWDDSVEEDKNITHAECYSPEGDDK